MVESDKSPLPKQEFMAVSIKHEPDIVFTESCEDNSNNN